MLCRLCLQEKPLADSHIIPEFLYKPLYDDKHQFKVVSTDAEVSDKSAQKGLREKLLCDDCEKRISKWENYTATFWNRKSQKPKHYDNALVFPGVDYEKFKLFEMSLIWRCSVSSRTEFRNLKLGIPNDKHSLGYTRHEERLRRMLLEENPGEPHEYGCAIFYSPILTPRLKDGLINAGMKRWQGHGLYRLFIQGTFWVYTISSHMQQFPFKGCFLQENGDLPIIKEHPLLDRWLKEYYNELKSAGKI